MPFPWMQRIALFAGLFVLSATTLSAQSAEPVYYDYNWKKCTAEKASFISVTEKTDSGYYRKDYFINSGKLQMAALYEDSACKTINGTAIYAHANGNVQRMIRKIHGKTEGPYVSYYSSGAIADSTMYHEGKPVGNQFQWHRNGFMADSVTHVNDSTFTEITWFDDGQPASAGRHINGKLFGTWIYYHHNGQITSREVYENNKQISVQHFDETGAAIPLDTNRNQHPADFKGGVDKWRNYLAKNLYWPRDYQLKNVSSVVVVVEMTIDENGNITDVEVVTPFHSAFDQIAYQVISKGPKWVPAVQHNRTVKYRFKQSVTFAWQ